MTIRYKLTNQDLTSHNDCKWELNEWKETSGEGELCTEAWLHCYSNPLLAILLNPIHANITNPKLFEVEVEGKCLTDKGLKEGWTRMRLVKELEIPEISIIQKVAFGILCAKEVYKDKKWNKWANNWLNGKDRSKESAYAASAAYAATAAYAAHYADDAAHYAYSWAAAYAAYAAYDAANATDLNLIELANKAMEHK